MEAPDRIIVAVDVADADSAARLVESLAGRAGAFKVGLELFTAAGPSVFQRLRDAGADRLFYDCKLHDIPNTVAGAVRAAARHALWMMNVHAAGGARMMRAAAASLDAIEPRPLLLGVTLLTSLGADELEAELGVALTPEEYVARLARLARDSGCDGVVASPHEIEAVRGACGAGFLIVTPGVRPTGAEAGDQRRTLTPGEAVRLGADYLVIGRPITGSPDPAQAALRIADEIASV